MGRSVKCASKKTSHRAAIARILLSGRNLSSCRSDQVIVPPRTDHTGSRAMSPRVGRSRPLIVAVRIKLQATLLRFVSASLPSRSRFLGRNPPMGTVTDVSRWSVGKGRKSCVLGLPSQSQRPRRRILRFSEHDLDTLLPSTWSLGQRAGPVLPFARSRTLLTSYAPLATCHIRIAKRRIPATTAIFLCFGFRATMRS